MSQKQPKHLSLNYKLNVENIPTKASDRLSLLTVMPAIFIGILMIVIALLEMSNGLESSGEWIKELPQTTRKPFLDPALVNASFMILGLGIVFSTIIAYIRYKKIYFNGRVFSESFRGVFGDVEMFKEHIRNYRGVRFRVEFAQSGILTKTKYIIELEHQDKQKTIPLYISTNGRAIYSTWHYYAKMLNKPTIITTPEGIEVKEVHNLDKNLKEYLRSNGKYSIYELDEIPNNLVYEKKPNRIVINRKKMSWNAFRIMGAFWLMFYTLIVAGASYFYKHILELTNSPYKTAFAFVIAYLILAHFIFALFKKDKIVVREDKLILMRKFLVMSRSVAEIYFEDINDIEISYNPTKNNYYLSVLSKDNIITFGRKMSLEDIRWLKEFIIFEIMK